jgi:hypothetical protein
VEEIEEFDASTFAELFGELDDEPTPNASPAEWRGELADPAMPIDELDVDEDDGWPTPESASYASYPGSAEPLIGIAEEKLEEEEPEEELTVLAAVGSRKIGAEPDRRERRNSPARVRRAQPDDDEVDGAPAQRQNRTVVLTLTAGLLVAVAAIVFVSYGGSRSRPGVAVAASRSTPAPAAEPVVAPAARVQRSPSSPTAPPAPTVARRASRVPVQRKRAPHRKPQTAVVTRAQAPPAPQRQPSPAPSTPSAPPPPARVYVPPAAAAPAARAAASSPAPNGLAYLGGGG